MIAEKIKENQNKTISDDLGNKIKLEWAKLPKWRKIPTKGNIMHFRNKLHMSKAEDEEFKKIFNIG